MRSAPGPRSPPAGSWDRPGRGAHRLTGGANPKAARRAGEVAKMRADKAYADLAPIVAELRAKGLSLRAIADRLNRDGHTTRRGKPWNATQIARVLARG
ncbi:MAG TPA: recombinase family protein [Isosphaeraceae bacterium]|nr:recombinase family protein [Isosphaeraceae bacterium]